MNTADILKIAKDIGVWLHSQTNDGQVPNDRRTVMSVSVFQHVLDIADGMIVLVERNLPGVAFTLARPLHEGYVQAVWLLTKATEDQLDRFAKGICPKLQTLVKDIGDDPETGGAYIKGMTEKNSTDFHNLTHGGMLHITRHQSETGIQPNYEADEVMQLLKVRNQYYLLTAFFLLMLMKKDDSLIVLDQNRELWSDAL